MKYSIFLAVLIFVSSCNSPKKNEEAISYKDVCEGYDNIDAEMLLVIEDIEEAFKDDRIFLKRFRDSQIYWTQYQDRHLRALYSKDWDLFYRKNYGKQIFNSCKCKELIRLTSLRVDELKMYLNGGPNNQKECPSAWNQLNDE